MIRVSLNDTARDLQVAFSRQRSAPTTGTYPAFKVTPEMMYTLSRSPSKQYGGFFSCFAPRLFGERVGTALTLALAQLETGLLSDEQFWELYLMAIEANYAIYLGEPYYALVRLDPKRGAMGPKVDGKPYRDHLLHPIIVYLLGCSLLNHQVNDKPLVEIVSDCLAKDNEAVADALDAFSFDDPPLTKLQWPDVVRESWCIAAFLHDLAYGMEAGIGLQRRFLESSFLKPLRAGRFDFHRQLLNELRGAGGKQKTFVDKYFCAKIETDLTSTRSHIEGLDHGQVIAAMVLSCYLSGPIENLPLPSRIALVLALIGVFRHDEESREDRLESLLALKEPLTHLLCLCDLFAEIRLVWREIDFEPKDLGSMWKFDVWLPLDELQGSRSAFKWLWQFKRSDSTFTDRGTYSYAKATGQGAEFKRKQYERLLKALTGLDAEAMVDVVDGYPATTS